MCKAKKIIYIKLSIDLIDTVIQFFSLPIIIRCSGIYVFFPSFFTIFNLRYRVCVSAAIAENVFTLISSQMSNDFATLFECVTVCAVVR